MRVVSTAGEFSNADNRGLLSGNGIIAGSMTVEGSILSPGNTGAGPVGTLTLGGSLTLTSGPRFGGTVSALLGLDFDPQNPDPTLRSDRVLLTSPSAQVNLSDVDLGLVLFGPPSPGQVFRFLEAPNAGNAVSGTFRTLPNGTSLNSTYGGINFAFRVDYGASYVQLTHAVPPPVNYAYARTFLVQRRRSE